MREVFYCEVCSAPMTLEKKGKSSKGKRIRRFACTVCDYRKTIYGDGYGDETIAPAKSIAQADKEFRQEEENRM